MQLCLGVCFSRYQLVIFFYFCCSGCSGCKLLMSAQRGKEDEINYAAAGGVLVCSNVVSFVYNV